ncbi:hypothetical protein GUITHDRAFT_138724 [Guillardia theta CCMP2712]|uniref:Uncharacterized protein n=1 Tax=Guillardia theta (strain CCMP2712) TaxID=905079 RepID=L1JBL0_GUITC|nr:hypothetical protein GUITHDRAFT_138724 [Guillardia theta CCMP2712]EKX45896.1 hypothetical protein GUITHDRAFT_138724 [Guillardia theta CCMP2712]|eukprot:XP_005832876.1 hypothetical protein GUITHDRAFT_138724 [Guillardia theta CCMP2712]
MCPLPHHPGTGPNDDNPIGDPWDLGFMLGVRREGGGRGRGILLAGIAFLAAVGAVLLIAKGAKQTALYGTYWGGYYDDYYGNYWDPYGYEQGRSDYWNNVADWDAQDPWSYNDWAARDAAWRRAAYGYGPFDTQEHADYYYNPDQDEFDEQAAYQDYLNRYYASHTGTFGIPYSPAAEDSYERRGGLYRAAASLEAADAKSKRIGLSQKAGLSSSPTFTQLADNFKLARLGVNVGGDPFDPSEAVRLQKMKESLRNRQFGLQKLGASAEGSNNVPGTYTENCVEGSPSALCDRGVKVNEATNSKSGDWKVEAGKIEPSYRVGISPERELSPNTLGGDWLGHMGSAPVTKEEIQAQR